MKEFLSDKKHIKACIIIAFFLVIGFAVQPEKEKYWVFSDDSSKVVYAAQSAKVIDIVASAGVRTDKHDGFILSPGNIIQVVKAVNVNVFKGDEQLRFATGAATVADALKNAGIDTSGFKVYPDLSARPTNEMNVVFLNKNEKIVEEQQAIDYSVEKKLVSHMELGETKVMKPGLKGSKNILVKIIEQADGQKIRQVIAETILMQPREQIVAMGTTDTVQTSRGAMRFKKVVDMRASAYTPWDEGCIGITKMGIPAKRGVVAVDPNVIPLGTKLYIPGYGQALAADIGGAIQGDRIDLCMDSKAEAFEFGRRDVKVYILE